MTDAHPPHFRCDCVPNLGPAHCHRCTDAFGREMTWEECCERRRTDRLHDVIFDAMIQPEFQPGRMTVGEQAMHLARALYLDEVRENPPEDLLAGTLRTIMHWAMVNDIDPLTITLDASGSWRDNTVILRGLPRRPSHVAPSSEGV